MSIIRWNPTPDPFNGLDEMFGRMPLAGGFAPAMDMYETDKAVVVETPLAGINPEDVKVSVEKGVLTVQGESKKEHEVDDKNYYRKEVRSGAFFRQVALPSAVLEDKVSAEFENGMLKITCPKSAETATKKINVKIIKKNKK